MRKITRLRLDRSELMLDGGIELDEIALVAELDQGDEELVVVLPEAIARRISAMIDELERELAA